MQPQLANGLMGDLVSRIKPKLTDLEWRKKDSGVGIFDYAGDKSCVTFTHLGTSKNVTNDHSTETSCIPRTEN